VRAPASVSVSASSSNKSWKLRDCATLINTLLLPFLSLHRTTATTAHAHEWTHHDEPCDAFALAIASFPIAIAPQRLELSEFRLHSTHVVLTDLVSRDPTGSGRLRAISTLDCPPCQPHGRARPSSPLRQTSTSKHWSRATKTFPTWIEYHAT
jgi:hypothetical protein